MARDTVIQIIERMFLLRTKIEQALIERKAYGGPGTFTGGEGSGHCRVPDPTAIQAIRNLVEMESVTLDDGFRVLHPERWLRVFYAVQLFCDADPVDREIFHRRYVSGLTSIPWTIEQSVYSRHLLKIRNYAKACAAQEQLVRIF